MVTDDVLNAMFRFRFERPSDVQTEAFCEELVGVVEGVVGDILVPMLVKNGDEDLVTEDAEGVGVPEATMHLDPSVHDRDVPLDVFSASDRAFLERARREYSPRDGTAMPRKGEMWAEKWFPEYASVLQMECVSVGRVRLRLVALDGWKRVVHALPGKECVHSAVPEKVDVLHCGELEWDHYKTFCIALRKEIDEAKERTGNKRHATLGEGPGHQKTPAFLCSCVRTALTGGEKSYSPSGGTTDVGMHTGGAPRDTCWPLVRAVLRQALPGSRGVFEKVLIRLNCSLLEAPLQRLCVADGAKAFWANVDKAFVMLQVIATMTTEMIDRGYASSCLEERCAQWRSEIDAVIQNWGDQPVRSFILPDRETLKSMSSTVELPQLFPPQPQDVRDAQCASKSGREKALRENQGYDVVDASTCTTQVLLQYLQPSEMEDHVALAQRNVEVFMYRLAANLESPGANTTCAPSDLLKITNWYRERRDQFAKENKYNQAARVITDSQVLLLSWIAYCWAHKTCCEEYESLNKHEIPLDWRRLSVAVLPEKESRVALQQVAAYIKHWNTRKGLSRAVFKFGDPEGTFLFAETMGKRSEYCDMYQRHVQDKNGRIDAMWTRIERRKRDVTDLRSQLADRQNSLRQAQDEINQLERSQYSAYYSLRNLREREGKILLSIQTMKDELKGLLKLHEFYISPLPEDEGQSLALLFLNFLPPSLDFLSQLCGSAQRELGLIDSSQYRVTPPCDTTWASHIAVRGNGCFSRATRFVTVFPHLLKEPNSYGPDSIDEVGSRDEFARRCAWYPVGVNNLILWKGPSESFIDVFKIPESDSMKHFTPDYSLGTSMQWALDHPGEEKHPGRENRGNLVYANTAVIDTASDDFAAYAALGSLRCYPVQQLRRVFDAIEMNALVWSNALVAAVVKQAVFQVGTLSNDDLPCFEWHPDLDSPSALSEFCTMMEAMAKRVNSSPSSSMWVPLLGELAGFLGQFHRNGREPVRVLSKAARRWAKELRQKWLSNVSTEERIELRTRECTLYGFALVCFSYGPCDNKDLDAICELVVLFANATLFATGKRREDVQDLWRVVRRIMTTRIAAVVKYVETAPSEIVSRLCGLINDSFPKDLKWSRVAYDDDRPSCCFEAIGSDRVHYLVNIFTGSVLTNGLPPGGLPNSIREHERFKMLFGNQDFEVVRHGEVYNTAQKLGDCAYSFKLVDNALLIEENGPNVRLQLCPDEWLAELRAKLPATLSSLYAQWFWEEKNCVLFRKKLVSERSVVYLMKFKDGKALCYEVPRSDRLSEYSAIVAGTDAYNVLVAHDETMIRVFGKFEDPSFVHVMVSPAKRLEVFLPRSGLRFAQNERGQLSSTEHRGYCLSTNQRLVGQLDRFERYLVLEAESTTCEKVARKLLFPSGHVVTRSGMVDIELRKDPADPILLCVVDEHPTLKTFEAESTEHRLLLAALYSACSNVVPCNSLGITGGQASNGLLRGSVSSRPFSNTSLHALLDIYRSSHLTTSTKLLVKELETRATQQEFLFPPSPSGRLEMDTVGELDAYVDASRLNTCAHELNVRDALTYVEECSVLGRSVLRTTNASLDDRVSPPVELTNVPVDSNYVPTVEKYLMWLVRPLPAQGDAKFPLTTSALNSLGAEMVNELRASWEAHHNEPQGEVAVDLRSLAARCREQLVDVVKKRSSVWSYLCDAVAASRNTPKAKLMTAAGFLPTLTKTDVLRSVLDSATSLHFAGALSAKSRVCFREATLRWMELCVLEDKLERIISRAEAATPPPMDYFVEELTCVREWNTEKHPYWLVFEVEGRLQIRPEQYIVARHLIENRGSICQLNMGRGKTRVILPMLFLYYRYNDRKHVVRAHFLSPLLSETRQFMHRVLSSGSLRLPFVELPFNRTIELSLRQVLQMQEAIDEIKQNGGFVLVAPEHRLSLELKRREVERSKAEDKEAVCEALDALLDSNQYIDVFDESDALLHHKYHLVYAVGSPVVLDGGSHRWIGAEALLRVLLSPASERVGQVLDQFPELFSVRTEYDERCGSFNGFTLSTAIDSSRRVELKKALAEDLIDHAPFDLSWLQVMGKRSRDIRSALVTTLCDSQVDCNDVLDELPPLDGVRSQFLVLRGLLAYGVLENCLEKRNRVTFGLPDLGTRKKELAIPFTAADLPAERSEFSHPDVSIVLTLLAYYHVGLREGEVQKAFETLRRLDESERTTYYLEWFKSVEGKVKSDHRDMLSELDHLSVDNAHQFAIVFGVYRYSTEVINFYLNRHVFPRGTQQYPHRWSRTAWDLVRGPTNNGFSGANDTHRLLPAMVTQREPDHAPLRGTNGKMISLLQKSFCGYEALDDRSLPSNGVSRPSWQQLLSLALKKKCSALIDTGALLAGVALDSAAHFLIEQLGCSATGGVTYYDTRKGYDCWVVLERASMLVRPLKTSSVHERDTFVIFDEARSRGSDMKLNADAVALLTLGPTITKDKLMQGAGRLRQLGRNQQLWLSSTVEVEQMLKARDGDCRSQIGVVEILDWVMHNTQQQCTTGLLEWAHNGIQYCANRGSADNELHDENWSLKSLYGGVIKDVAMYEVITSQLQATRVVEEGAVNDVASTFDARAEAYGREDTVRVTGFGEECERELQVEEEEEVEQELPSLQLQPCSDIAWKYSQLLRTSCVDDLSSSIAGIMPVQKALEKLVIAPPSLRDIAWSSTKVYGTRNFWETVVSPPNDSSFDATGFLRFADSVITFEDGSVLMLSECEADAVLKMLLVTKADVTEAACRGCFGLVHLGFAARAITTDSDAVALARIPLSLGFDHGTRRVPSEMDISVTAIVACQLLNGETQFASRNHAPLMERVLRKLLQPLKKREETLRAFVEARRMPQRWSRSFLQDLTRRMDLEDDTLSARS